MATNLPEGTDSIIEDSIPEEPPIEDFGGDDEVESVLGVSAPPPAGGRTTDAGAGDAKPGEAKPTDAKATIGDAKAKLGEAAAGLRGQATDKAREYALMGKDRATESLHGVSKMIEDAAATVDDKVGAQYGDYARQAAATVKGFATGLEGKDVDELFAQARDVVAKSPAIAIGAAAALGFVLSRIIKAGFEPVATADEKDVAFTPDPGLGTKA